jgi:two-component system NtrC family sensor kinase
MNTLELLKTEISPESKRRKILEMALSETVRLSDLLRKMLSFSKPDQEEKQAVDLNTVLDEILILHEKQLQENDIKIKTFFAEALPQISASKNQLRQVFLNLVANARDAMPSGGTLSVKTVADKENVKIEISDSGVGIKEEHIKKIFDSFFTTKDTVKGVGLGLSVCYGFIKDHGGDIEVKSKENEGTTFSITFPPIKNQQRIVKLLNKEFFLTFRCGFKYLNARPLLACVSISDFEFELIIISHDYSYSPVKMFLNVYFFSPSSRYWFFLVAG